MRIEALLLGILTLLPTGFQSERETSYSSIRKIDFGNFTYPARPSVGGRGAFTLRNGEMPPERDADGHVIGMWLELLKVVYGDITGDGAEEAIVIHDWITGGSATPHVVYVYTLEKGRPKFLWGTTTGDRADGGLKSAYAEGGYLVLETYSPEGKRGDCCPVAYIKTRYQLHGNKISVVGKPEAFPLSNKTK
ncbi:MAG TPA: hypothetical protein VG324_01035 [Blastocatellia bacterium]|nr:hypothetical protein [Blastocatellia bacterium]